MGQNRYKFLLIDDNEDTQMLVARSLRMLPHDLTWVTTAAEASAIVKRETFDFVLVDVGLPDGDGYTLCLEVTSTLPDVPVFFLTGRNSSIDLLAGFSMGAEDFITKPFRPYEFRARVIARLKKYITRSGRDFVVEVAGLQVNLTQKRAWAGGTEVSLTSPELYVLAHFICNPDRPITAECVHYAAMAGGAGVAAPVTSHIKTLRKKLGAYGACIVDLPEGDFQFKPVSQPTREFKEAV